MLIGNYQADSVSGQEAFTKVLLCLHAVVRLAGKKHLARHPTRNFTIYKPTIREWAAQCSGLATIIAQCPLVLVRYGRTRMGGF